MSQRLQSSIRADETRSIAQVGSIERDPAPDSTQWTTFIATAHQNITPNGDSGVHFAKWSVNQFWTDADQTLDNRRRIFLTATATATIISICYLFAALSKLRTRSTFIRLWPTYLSAHLRCGLLRRIPRPTGKFAESLVAPTGGPLWIVKATQYHDPHESLTSSNPPERNSRARI